MKRYTIEVVFDEGSDEFWEEITADNNSGADALLQVVREELQNYFPESVRLVKFEDKKFD